MIQTEKYLLLIIFILGFIATPCTGQNSGANINIEDLLQRASEQIENANETDALELFKQILEQDSIQFDALWNTSVLYGQRGKRSEDSSARESHYNRSNRYADRCLEHHPQKAPCHFAKALIIGRLSEDEGTRERLKQSIEVKAHADKAIELNPDFSRTWHLLGVWHTKVANLSRFERIAVRALFGKIPEGASNQKAEEAFKKAMELNPGNILVHLDFARFYIETDEDEKAINMLEKLLELEPTYEGDKHYQDMARDLLSNLR